MGIFVITYYGDLRDPMSAHPSLEAALATLAARYGQVIDSDPQTGAPWGYATPDPEDDRIVIWEATPGQMSQAVWHFSGWHYDPDGADLPGGPLPQGKLPGHDRTLYELAMVE